MSLCLYAVPLTDDVNTLVGLRMSTMRSRNRPPSTAQPIAKKSPDCENASAEHPLRTLLSALET
jgi:hypothetical protein